jgi:hypothetical protein
VAVAFGAKAVILFATARIMLHADARPVVKRVAESNVTAVAHQHDGSLSTLSCDRRDAGVGSKCMIISFRKELWSLG